jgi:hypothetical protein
MALKISAARKTVPVAAHQPEAQVPQDFVDAPKFQHKV